METMTIKAVNKAGTGFMAEGKEGWFNISKGADISFSGLTKGMRIEVDANDKWVKAYNKLSEAKSLAQDKPVPGAYSNPDTQDRIARGNASNAVLGSVGLLGFVKDVSGSAAESIQMTKDLIEEVANYISTGSFEAKA